MSRRTNKLRTAAPAVVDTATSEYLAADPVDMFTSAATPVAETTDTVDASDNEEVGYTFAEATVAETTEEVAPVVVKVVKSPKSKSANKLSPRASEYLSLLLSQYVGPVKSAEISSDMGEHIAGGMQVVVTSSFEVIGTPRPFLKEEPSGDVAGSTVILNVNRRMVNVRLLG